MSKKALTAFNRARKGFLVKGSAAETDSSDEQPRSRGFYPNLESRKI
jgi:hypothetical protein